jgi:hypothetical protein
VTGWIAAVAAVLTVLGALLRISFQIGVLVQRVGDHAEDSRRVHDAIDKRLQRLEAARARR